jgi:hypothetical protein
VAWMFVCIYSVFVLSCVSSGLATGWSPVQEVLPTVYKCKIKEPHKRRPRPDMGCKRHWMDVDLSHGHVTHYTAEQCLISIHLFVRSYCFITAV